MFAGRGAVRQHLVPTAGKVFAEVAGPKWTAGSEVRRLQTAGRLPQALRIGGLVQKLENIGALVRRNQNAKNFVLECNTSVAAPGKIAQTTAPVTMTESWALHDLHQGARALNRTPKPAPVGTRYAPPLNSIGCSRNWFAAARMVGLNSSMRHSGTAAAKWMAAASCGAWATLMCGIISTP